MSLRDLSFAVRFVAYISSLSSYNINPEITYFYVAEHKKLGTFRLDKAVIWVIFLV